MPLDWNGQTVANYVVASEEKRHQNRLNSNTADDLAVSRPIRSAGHNGQTALMSAGQHKSLIAAQRSIASQISAAEVGRLDAEHRDLATRRVLDGLSASDENRLRLIRWKLDQIEDAAIGERLDELEEFAERQEATAQQVAALLAELQKNRLR